MSDTKKIGVGELVTTLRHELQTAMHNSENEDLRFRIDSIEIELKMTATRSVEAGGGVKFWVCDASSKGSTSSDNVQTVKLKLAPATSTGGEILVGRKKSGG